MDRQFEARVIASCIGEVPLIDGARRPLIIPAPSLPPPPSPLPLLPLSPILPPPCSSYSCACALGWTGYNCELDFDECTTNPCLHDGACSDSSADTSIPIDAFRCTCIPGWANGICSNSFDEESDSSLSGFMQQYVDQCSVTGASASTNPLDGSFFAGICDIDMTECSSNPCHNAPCTDSTSDPLIAIDFYFCDCPPQTSGW